MVRFTVIYPSIPGITWQGFNFETITWNVANTTASPISASTVDIFLSLDNGQNYDIQLADDVANNGSFTTQVPNIETSIARIMVINSGGTFFDISNNSFDIEVVESGFFFMAEELETTVCQDFPAVLNFSIQEIGMFDGDITLQTTESPVDSDLLFSTETAVVGESFSLTLSDLQNVEPGIYTVTVVGVSDDLTNDVSVQLTVLDSDLEAAEPQSPADEAENQSLMVDFDWVENASIGVTYTLVVASDSDFSEIIITADSLEDASFQAQDLLPFTTYYWYVINSNSCTVSIPSSIFSFTTFSCASPALSSDPQAISADGTISLGIAFKYRTIGHCGRRKRIEYFRYA